MSTNTSLLLHSLSLRRACAGEVPYLVTEARLSMNSQPQFPRRTASELTLPDGTKVWVQTLNGRHIDEVSSAAHNYALLACQDFIAGGKLRKVVIAEAKELSPENQAVIIINQFHVQQMQEFAWERHPNDPEPQMIEELAEAEAFVTARQAWEKKCEAKHIERKTWFEAEVEKKKTELIEATAKFRTERCVSARVTQEFNKAFARQFVDEKIYRATRRADDHRQLFFENVREVEDLDDDLRNAILNKLDELEVPPDAIPTSPPDS